MHFTVDINVNLPDKLLQFLENYLPPQPVKTPERVQGPISFESVGELVSFSENENQLSIIEKPGKKLRKKEDLDKLFESHKKTALAFIYRKTAFELKDIIVDASDYKNSGIRQRLTQWLLTQTDHVIRKEEYKGRSGRHCVYYPFWYENRVKVFAPPPNRNKPQAVRGATWRALGPIPDSEIDEETDPYLQDAREA